VRAPDRQEARPAPGRRPTARRINWAAGVTAFAALLSGTAAMVTAGAGIWRPPVPIPVPKISITWVAASPPPGPAAASGTATPSPTPVTTPLPTSYQADWAASMDGWTGVPQWKTIPGILVSDGTSHTTLAYASRGEGSVQPPRQPSAGSYGVEARIQIVDPTQGSCYVAIQLREQAEGQGGDRHGYVLGYSREAGAFVGRFFPGASYAQIKQTAFSPGADWHVYRAEVAQNQLTLKIDGSVALQATDNNYLDAGGVGLVNSNCQVQVSSFGVAAL
jgi:hypothetical protein